VPGLVTFTGDRAYVWDLEVDHWFDLACRAAGRNLTRLEWSANGPRDEPYHRTCSQWADPSPA
jgi:hypothetical protein